MLQQRRKTEGGHHEQSETDSLDQIFGPVVFKRRCHSGFLRDLYARYENTWLGMKMKRPA
jgi:hypothetical protein